MSDFLNQQLERARIEEQQEVQARKRIEEEQKSSDSRLICFFLIVAMACIVAAQIGFILKVW